MTINGPVGRIDSTDGKPMQPMQPMQLSPNATYLRKWLASGVRAVPERSPVSRVSAQINQAYQTEDMAYVERSVHEARPVNMEDAYTLTMEDRSSTSPAPSKSEPLPSRALRQDKPGIGLRTPWE